MACCLTAPSCYLNQCRIFIIGVLWYSPHNNFKVSTLDINSSNEFENFTLKITATSPRSRWVKNIYKKRSLPVLASDTAVTREWHKSHDALHDPEIKTYGHILLTTCHSTLNTHHKPLIDWFGSPLFWFWYRKTIYNEPHPHIKVHISLEEETPNQLTMNLKPKFLIKP